MWTYKKAGVNIDLADQLASHLKKSSSTIGGFSGLFPLPSPSNGKKSDTMLVACTDGVGTKLKIAFALNRHHTIGIDLVAMCVNDLITCGAKPLIFLDYFATGKLDLKKAKRVMEGILEGCRQSGSVLLGGETAQMPGFYPAGEYDLAGFSAGVVSRSEVIDGSKIFPGDLILGLPSSGLHSNGFSLVRRVFRGKELLRWGPKLLTPTRIYVAALEALRNGFKKEGHILLGMAHITGGGLPENLPRILPKNCKAVLHPKAWRIPPIFSLIQKNGRVPEKEMWRTFNMGIGMAIVIRSNSLPLAIRILPEALLIGEIQSGRPEVVLQ